MRNFTHRKHNERTQRTPYHSRCEKLRNGEDFLFRFAKELDSSLEEEVDPAIETVVCDNGEIQIDCQYSQMYDIVLYKKATPGYTVKCLRSYDGSSKNICEIKDFHFMPYDKDTLVEAILNDLKKNKMISYITELSDEDDDYYE